MEILVNQNSLKMELTGVLDNFRLGRFARISLHT